MGGVEFSTVAREDLESHLSSEISEVPERGEEHALRMSAEELSRQEGNAGAEDSDKGSGGWLLKETGGRWEVRLEAQGARSASWPYCKGLGVFV